MLEKMSEQSENLMKAPEYQHFQAVVSDLAALRKASQARRYGSGVFPPELPSRAVIARLLGDLSPRSSIRAISGRPKNSW